LNSQVVESLGLGATISEVTATGKFSLLLAATAVMTLVVVLTNRIVWHPLARASKKNINYCDLTTNPMSNRQIRFISTLPGRTAYW
jgi:hypothetical protein